MKGIQLSATFRMGSSQRILQNQISENRKKTSTTCAHQTIPILTDTLLNDLLCNIMATKLQNLVYLTNFLEYNSTFCCYLLHEHATVSCCMEIFTVFYHLIMFNLISYVSFYELIISGQILTSWSRYYLMILVITRLKTAGVAL